MAFTRIWESEANAHGTNDAAGRFYINEGSDATRTKMPEGYTVISLWEHVPDEGEDIFVQQSGYIELDQRDAYIDMQQRRAKTLSNPANYDAWVEWEEDRDRRNAEIAAEAKRQREARRAAAEASAKTYNDKFAALRSIFFAAQATGDAALTDEVATAVLNWRRAASNDRRNLTATADAVYDDVEAKYGHLDG